MEPILKKIPPLRRAAFFIPSAIVAGLIVLLGIAIPTNNIALAVLVSPIAGILIAWVLLGWPRLVKADGSPMIAPRLRPWLFFPVAIILAIFLYPFAGLALTAYVPIDYVVYAPMAAAVVMAIGLAYLATGFPPIWKDFRELWGRVPPRTRPWLAVPVALVLSLSFYFLVGWALTSYESLSWAPLAALPVALLLGVALAVLVFGVPKPERPVGEMLPKPSASARPFLLLATWIVFGVLLTLGSGVAITSSGALPRSQELIVSTLVGFVLAFPIATLVWGLPRRWRKLPDYTPRHDPEVRIAAVPALGMVVLIFATLLLGNVGLDIVPSFGLGFVLSVLAMALLGGGFRRILRPRIPDFPETVQPVIFLTLALGVAALTFVVLLFSLPLAVPGLGETTVFLPTLLALSVGAGILVGLPLSQRGLFRMLVHERSRRRALKREIAAIRKGTTDDR
ncbi:MAG: hypothetical protein ACYDDF_09930 [Thermoplasmatota archaeon]